jgi:drug/metabolite transporter superfamily protein YnfA
MPSPPAKMPKIVAYASYGGVLVVVAIALVLPVPRAPETP